MEGALLENFDRLNSNEFDAKVVLVNATVILGTLFKNWHFPAVSHELEKYEQYNVLSTNLVKFVYMSIRLCNDFITTTPERP